MVKKTTTKSKRPKAKKPLFSFRNAPPRVRPADRRPVLSAEDQAQIRERNAARARVKRAKDIQTLTRRLETLTRTNRDELVQFARTVVDRAEAELRQAAADGRAEREARQS